MATAKRTSRRPRAARRPALGTRAKSRTVRSRPARSQPAAASPVWRRVVRRTATTTRTGARRAAALRKTLSERPLTLSVEFEDLGPARPRETGVVEAGTQGQRLLQAGARP